MLLTLLLTIIITAGDTAIALTTEPIVSTSAKDDSVKVSVDKALVVRSALEVTTTQDAIINPTSEDPIVTSDMR